MRRVITRRALVAAMLVALMLLFVAGCEDQLRDDGDVVLPPKEEEPVRPEIPRTNVSETIPPSKENPEGPIIRRFLNATTIVVKGEDGLVAGDLDEPFLIGKRLGDLVPVLTRHDLAILASRQPSLNGRPLRAESYLRFDFEENTSGILRVARDDERELPVTELYFEEGKPIFEYAYLLYDGAFPILVGQELDLFGHTYLLKEATNTTLELYGTDIEQYLILTNGSELSLNGKRRPDTAIEVDPWHFTIRYDAPDVDEEGLSLRPGETLRGKLRAPEILLNPLFDLEFEGLEEVPSRTITLRRRGDAVELNCTVAGGSVALPLVGLQDGGLVWGDEEVRLHLQECETHCVRADDWFLLSHDGISVPLQFRGVSERGDEAEFKDPSGERHAARLVDDERREGNDALLDGMLQFGGTFFRFEVKFNGSRRDEAALRIDQDGEGGIGDDDIPLFLLDGYELRFPPENQSADERVLVLVAPQRYREGLDEEEFPIRVVRSGGSPLVGLGAGANVTLYRAGEDEEDETAWAGISSRGISVTLEDSSDGRVGERLRAAYPADYQAGVVRIIG